MQPIEQANQWQVQQSDELTFGMRLSYEQKENIKLLSSKFLNKFVKADKRNYSALLWNTRIVSIREGKFRFYKFKGNFDQSSIATLRREEEQRYLTPEQIQAQQEQQQVQERQQQLKQGSNQQKTAVDYTMEILPEIIYKKGLLSLKGEISLIDIQRVQWPEFEQSEDQKQRLTLHFSKGKMTLFNEKGRASRSEGEKGETYWMFEIGNFMKDDHRERIERESRQEEERKKREKKKQEEIERQVRELEEQKKSVIEQEAAIKKRNLDAQHQVEQELLKKQEEEILMKERQKRLQEESDILAAQIKAEQERMKMNSKLLEGCKKQIENSFEFYYFLLWEDQKQLIAQSIRRKNETEEGMNERVNTLTNQLNIRIFQVIGFFRQKATRYFRELVQEMVLPTKIQKIKKIEARNNNPYYWLKEEGEDLYIYNEIIFRVTRVVQTTDASGRHVLNDFSMKCLANEFRGNKVLTDVLFNLRRDCYCPLQVPLTCLVEYLGFRAMCIAVPQIFGDRTIVHGPTSSFMSSHAPVDPKSSTSSSPAPQPVYKENVEVQEELERVARVMNLKSFKFRSKDIARQMNSRQSSSSNNRKDEMYREITVHLSLFNEIHLIQENQWNELVRILSRANTKRVMNDEAQKQYSMQDQLFENIQKLMEKDILDEKEGQKRADKITELTIDLNWFLLIQQIVANHSKEGEKGMNMRTKRASDNRYFYVLKNASLFPVQFYISSKDQEFDFAKQFRPEFLFDFAANPLSNGAFINPTTKNISEDDILAAEYSKAIVELILPLLVSKLEKLQVLIYDSYSVAKAFHSVSILPNIQE